ncbi:MAG: hypothetical protein U0821_20960 [Chloroflexota bacterium]
MGRSWRMLGRAAAGLGRLRLLTPLLLLVGAILFSSNQSEVALGQERRPNSLGAASVSTPVAPPSRGGQPPANARATGWLNLIWGDGQPGSGVALPPVAHVIQDDGTVHTLHVDPALLSGQGGLRAFDRQRVTVEGAWTTHAPGRFGSPSGQVLEVSSLRSESGPTRSATRLAGSRAWVSILCRFADATSTTPRDPGYVSGLVSGASYPSLDNYWRENSGGLVDLNGSAVAGWYNLPQPRSYYVYNNQLDFTRAANDCTAAADADVYFPNYAGVNLMFNQDLDCCAWGGSRTMTLDGTTKTYSMTWMPPWGFNTQYVLAHEVGHGFGLPHSSGPYTGTYDSDWDTMSGGGTCINHRDPTYGCVGVHTIGHHKDLLSWIPADRKYTGAVGSSATITLERSALPSTTAGRYYVARIPVGSSTTKSYTVEVRQPVSYDMDVPGQGVLIHKVDTALSDRDAQVVDADGNGNANDGGAIWLVGETYTDAANGITIAVVGSDATGYQVTITNTGPSTLPTATPTASPTVGPTATPTATVVVSAPANDPFAGAQALVAPEPPKSLSIKASSQAATIQAGEPSDGCAAGTAIGRSIWYRVAADPSLAQTFGTLGSGFTSVTTVYTGSTVDALTRVTCAQQAGTKASSVNLPAGSGVTYWIQVAGRDGTGGPVSITLKKQRPARLEPDPAPATDPPTIAPPSRH